MQQSRAVLVTGDMHHKVWDSVIENYTKSFKDDGESESIPPILFTKRGPIGSRARYGRIEGTGMGDLLPREPDGVVKGKTDGRREAR